MNDMLSALEYTQVLFAHAYHFPNQERYRAMLREKRVWLTDDIAKEYEVGLAPISKYKLQEVLAANGHSRKAILDSGIIKVADNGDDEASLYHRWTLPLRNPQGEIASFAGRSIDDDMITYKRPKWKNLRDTALFKRSQCLYMLDRVPDDTTSINLVEGYFDAIYAHSVGITNTVCILGVQMTIQQVAILYQCGIRQMTLALDGDLPGQLGAMKAATLVKQKFTDKGYPVELRVAWLPDGKDPDELEPTELVKVFGGAKFIDAGLHSPSKIHPSKLIESVIDSIDMNLHENVLKNGGWSTINNFSIAFDPKYAEAKRKEMHKRFGTKINFKNPDRVVKQSNFRWDYNE